MKYKHCKKHNINSENNSELFVIKTEYKKKNGKKFGPYSYKICVLCKREHSKKYAKKNPEKIKELHRKYLEKPENKAKARIRKLKFIENNREHIRKYLNNWEKNKRKIDPTYGLIKNLRSRLWTVLKKHKKSNSTLKLTGCTLEQLKKHLENKFEDGMNWDNYGVWHVDHIIACANFDFSDPKQQEICFHYTNLQPMWGEENAKKGSRLI